MELDQIIRDLLHSDKLFTTLPRSTLGFAMVKPYRKPGRLFGGLGKPPSPDYRAYEKLWFPAVRLFMRDYMDIECLWKPWTLAVTPAGIAQPCCTRRELGGYNLHVFIYGPFVDGALAFWDDLHKQLDDSRRL